ncbi:hypothetical protein CAPTEDRAFT_196536 [Capitella teleta]|uniref:THAP-type domain-containing protein n=1 Tax=Capitella teleta TaxID=283909 RepID=R7TY13_CAPTE|nr:hypothetical protein CAPTEDRAFT_196536 [Capitella teleta]|eukprot:ELT98644.1 hypothetical protein CAPTEDRAFT_196536 [Capitella teleta]
MSKSSGSFCAAAGCSEKKQVSRNRHFFRFPKDSNRCKRWVQNCRREDLMKASPLHLYKNCTMCDLHFTDSQFMNAQSKASLIRVHLMSNVIVKLQSKVQSLSSSNSTATPTELTGQAIHAGCLSLGMKKATADFFLGPLCWLSSVTDIILLLSIMFF